MPTWFWCVSNPPSWQKKICRFSAERRRRRVELDDLCHLLQLIAERGVGKCRRQRHVGVERLADAQRLLRRPAGGGDERRIVSIVRSDSIALRRATSSAAVPKPFSTSTWLSAVGAGGNRERRRRLAAREDAARQRGDHRQAGAERGEPVGRAPAPPGLSDAVGDRRLPLRHLVRMREQLIRTRRAARVILPRQRLHQRADIADDRKLLLATTASAVRQGSDAARTGCRC